ncbi:MAG: hypothetical protein WCT32_05690 [Patescibacteria group bacterium]|jgi:hypothetical protein
MVESETITYWPATKTLAAAPQLGRSAVEVGLPPSSGRTSYTYKEYVEAIYNFSIGLGTSLATLMIVYAGYKYLTSAGNQSAIGDAKEIATGALLGLAVLILIKFILNFIGLDEVKIL